MKKASITIMAVIMFSCPVYAVPILIYGGTFNLPIEDSMGIEPALTEATINVPDHFDIIDLDVGINITHTLVLDLRLFLRSPQGTRLCLNELEFYIEGENYTDTVFDDEAALSITDAQPPFTGSFRPLGPEGLQVFDGQDAFGTWVLEIWDIYPFDTGTLDSCELIFEIPEPASFLLFYLGGVALLRKQRS